MRGHAATTPRQDDLTRHRNSPAIGMTAALPKFAHMVRLPMVNIAPPDALIQRVGFGIRCFERVPFGKSPFRTQMFCPEFLQIRNRVSVAEVLAGIAQGCEHFLLFLQNGVSRQWTLQIIQLIIRCLWCVTHRLR